MKKQTLFAAVVAIGLLAAGHASAEVRSDSGQGVARQPLFSVNEPDFESPQVRRVQVDRDVLRASEFDLPVGSVSRRAIRLNDAEPARGDGTTATFALDNLASASFAVFVTKGALVGGVVVTEAGQYELSPDRFGGYAYESVTAGKQNCATLASGADALSAKVLAAAAPSARRRAAAHPGRAQYLFKTDVWFSALSEAALGGLENAALQAQVENDLKNTIFRRSGIGNIQFQVLHVYRYAKGEVGASGTSAVGADRAGADLSEFANDESVRSLRDADGAHFGFLWEETTDGYSITWRPIGRFDRALGFAVIARTQALHGYAGAHEQVHMFDGDHDPRHAVKLAAGKVDPSPEGRGYGNPNAAQPWACIMSQASEDWCDWCVRMPIISSADPAIRWNGDVVGNANQDNAGVVEKNASTIYYAYARQ